MKTRLRPLKSKVHGRAFLLSVRVSASHSSKSPLDVFLKSLSPFLQNAQLSL